jgi:hypothetical protein
MAREAAGLVRDLGSASPTEQLEAARALEQLAASPGGAQRIQRAGGVPVLLRLLQGEQAEELQLAAAYALEHMAEQKQGLARDICKAGAGRAVAQSLPGSRSAALTQLLLQLLMTRLTTCGEQQLLDELAASPSCLQRLAQLAADPSQDPCTQSSALTLLAGPMLATGPSAVAAAAAPHAAALVQHLSSSANDTPQTRLEQTSAARLVALLADESAELAATMVAAGALPRLVRLMRASLLLLQSTAVAALGHLVCTQPSTAARLAAVDGVAEVLVQLLASHQPPASCQQAWDAEEAATSCEATTLLMALSKADAGQARRAVASGALQQLTRVLCWGAQRLEWLCRQGLWEPVTDTSSTIACGVLSYVWQHSGPSSAVITPALQAELVQLVQLVLQHGRSQDALIYASQLLVLLRDPSIESTQALEQATAEVLRQLQPGSQPDRAAAIAALLAELTGEVQQQQAGGSGAGTAPAGPSSSGAAAQAGGQAPAVASECAACNALPPAGRKFQVCAGCRAVRYCSPACQKAAWRSGHKAACRAKGGVAEGSA